MKINQYKTQSLALASALLATSSASLSSISIDQFSQRATFCFNHSNQSKIEEIIQRFWGKNLPVDCSTYFEALKHIKNQLYSEKGTYEK
jgi:hypothetical protein